MADFNQFGSAVPPQAGVAHHCAQCEAMLADALDGTLSAQDQATFDLHMAGCPSCSAMLADAERGLRWMETLKADALEPPAALLERIFSQTTGAQTAGAKATGAAADAALVERESRHKTTTLLGHPIAAAARTTHPQAFGGNVVPFRSRFANGLRSLGQSMLQPRLAMTAAMAFFSIALTMNLTGVRLSSFKASDLRPSSILRSCYSAKARVMRYGDNLRVVYELESRVRDLQRSDDDFPASAPATQNAPATSPAQPPSGAGQQPGGQAPRNEQNQQNQSPHPKPGQGTSRRETPGGLLVGPMHRRGTESATLQHFAVFFPESFYSTRDEGGRA